MRTSMTRLTRCARRRSRNAFHVRVECPIVKTASLSILAFLTTLTLFPTKPWQATTQHSESSPPETNWLQRPQVFDQIMILRIAETKFQKAVVVLDNIKKCRKAPVVEETALGVRPETL
jgi:hypothetical protein